jgi:glucosamine 6-phosphate synthetase-like amidotransferase/phosphosugar isomerase protein
MNGAPGEMKHGPNALIDETLPVVCIATKDPADPSSVLKYEKTLSNIQEVTARSGRVIAIAIEGDDHIRQLVEHVIPIPSPTNSCYPSWRSSPCNCSPTTSLSAAAAMWISRGIWRKA